MAQHRTTLRGIQICVAVALIGACTYAGFAAFPAYDAAYHLAWARDLVRGGGLDMHHASAATPHPLALLGALALSWMPVRVAAGVAVAAATATTAVSVGLTARLGHRLGGSPAAAAASGVMALTSAPLAVLTLDASPDVVYLVLGLAAVVLTLTDRHRVATAVWCVAALQRPEALAMAAVPLIAGLRVRSRDQQQRRGREVAFYAAGAALVAAAWLTVGVVAGDPLVAFRSASDNAALNHDPRGLPTALVNVVPDLARPLGWIVLGAAFASAVVLALAGRRRRADTPRRTPRQTQRSRRPLAGAALSDAGPRAQQAADIVVVGTFMALGVVVFLAQGVAGTPLMARYLLLPAMLAGPLAVGGIVAVIAGSGSPNRRIITVAALAALTATSIAANVSPWHDLATERGEREQLLTEARGLLDTSLARECGHGWTVRSSAMVPVAALMLDARLHEIALGRDPGDGVLLQPLTIDAATLPGFGPATEISEQAQFPANASPRQATADWALYSNCVISEAP